MKIPEQLLQKKIDKARQSYNELDKSGFSRKLHKVIDVLVKANPKEWIAIGEMIMYEGAYQMIAKKEGREIHYDTNTNTTEDELFTATNTTTVS